MTKDGYLVRAENRQKAINLLHNKEAWSEDGFVPDEIDEARDILTICRRVVSNEQSYALEEIEDFWAYIMFYLLHIVPINL